MIEGGQLWLVLMLVATIIYKGAKHKQWPTEKHLIELVVLGVGAWGAVKMLWLILKPSLPEKVLSWLSIDPKPTHLPPEVDPLFLLGGVLVIAYITVKGIYDILVKYDVKSANPAQQQPILNSPTQSPVPPAPHTATQVQPPP